MIHYFCYREPARLAEIRELIIREIVASTDGDELRHAMIVKGLASAYWGITEVSDDEEEEKAGEEESLNGAAAEHFFTKIWAMTYTQRFGGKVSENEEKCALDLDAIHMSHLPRSVIKDAAMACAERDCIIVEKLREMHQELDKAE